MLRIGFVTCVQLGLSCMEAAYEAGGQLVFALTLRDDLARAKSGRVHLDAFCAQHRIPLHKTRNINDPDAIEAIRGSDLDWLFVVGWSQIARSAVLGAVRKGVLGMHPTLLPVGRGRAPIPWALLLELDCTGVTLFKLDEGVDTGPIVAQQPIAIAARETATTLYRKVDDAHVLLMKNVWAELAADRLQPRPQDEEGATTWRARTPEDGRLDPAMDVSAADRLIRAVTHPYPGAFIDGPCGRIRVWETGAPLQDLGGADSKGSVLRVQFAEGWLDATQWQIESKAE